MAARTVSWLIRPGTFRALMADVQLAIRLFREPAVAPYLKVVPLAALAYVLSPLDVLPDVIPVIGQLDDLGVAILGVKAFLRICPADATAFHREAIAERRPFSPMPSAGDVIDAEFRRH